MLLDTTWVSPNMWTSPFAPTTVLEPRFPTGADDHAALDFRETAVDTDEVVRFWAMAPQDFSHHILPSINDLAMMCS